MNIGELFVSLGVKGSEKTLGAITGVRTGLKETSAMAFETKAALVGAMYALERLFATSGQRGTDLTNFNAVLGVSAKTLQQYQYAARQAGVSNQEVEGSFKTLQATMTKTLMGEGAPKGLARVAQLTGGLTAQDMKRFADQPHLLIQKLQEYAAKETNVGLRNEVLKSFGLGDGMIAALSRKAFQPDVLKKAPTYSEGETASLAKTNAAWSNLGNKIEMAFGHLNAKHGGEIIGDISKVVDSLMKLSEALLTFAERAKIFEWIGKSIEGWTKIFQFATDAVGTVNGAIKDPEKANSLKDKTLEFFSGLPGVFSEMTKDIFGEDTKKPGAKVPTAKTAPTQPETTVTVDVNAPAAPTAAKSSPGAAPNLRLVVPPSPTLSAPGKSPIAPAVAPGSAAAGSSQTIDVTQTLNFNHDGKDAKKTGDSTKKAIQDAFRQVSAQGQGS